eukprot:10668429-Karenia_brevis.AAC.1
MYWTGRPIGRARPSSTLMGPPDPRLRRRGWARVINIANSNYAKAPVAYFGEHGSLDGRQTAPRAEL